jgi:hypothetical protein
MTQTMTGICLNSTLEAGQGGFNARTVISVDQQSKFTGSPLVWQKNESGK